MSVQGKGCSKTQVMLQPFLIDFLTSSDLLLKDLRLNKINAMSFCDVDIDRER